MQGQLDEEEEESEKKKRIREALKTPAANIITDLRRENPQASAGDYIEALELAYGDTRTADELSIQFHAFHQKRGEKASEFLTRLHLRCSSEVGPKGRSSNRHQENATEAIHKGH